ncbi:MAG: zf-TFIIB domain-containing protein [Sulfuritalea sp.]|nr:zf-TFIIB domain-containing protein [Sulfuritalea sp.]MDP1984187.1 zf-TFIIB domain-containing protein [Sulfuritalea sp.]
MNPVSACPSCRAPMSAHRFPRKLNGEVELDLCFACQGIWFDDYESLQLAPAGVVDLFRLVHEHRDDQRLPLANPLRCPRCGERLIHSQDRVKSGLFNYLRCGQHGRFINFSQFMIEKGFVRQLTPVEIKEISARIGVVRCTGCGAPVDIRKESACNHCRAPIAILDPQAVEQALAGYHQAALKQAAPPAPALLAETILYAERERSRQQRERGNALTADIGDLLLDGVAMVWSSLRR